MLLTVKNGDTMNVQHEVLRTLEGLKLKLTGRDPYLEEAMIAIICSNIARKLINKYDITQLDNSDWLTKQCAKIATNIANWGMLNMPTSKIASMLYFLVEDNVNYINMRPVTQGCMCAQGFGSGTHLAKEVFEAITQHNQDMISLDRSIKFLLSDNDFLATYLEIKL